MNKSRFIIIIFVLAMVALLPISKNLYAAEEEFIKKGEILTLQRSIEIALKKQPNILASMYNVNAAQSRIGQARAGDYPQIDLSSGYNRISSASRSTTGSSTTNLGTGVDTDDSFDQFTSSATLRQTIFDFGKTSTQVKVRKLDLDSSRSDLDNITTQIVFNVKQAYYNVLQANKNKAVSEETVKQFQQHLDQARGFFEVGTKPKFDVTKAEVDLSNAKLNLIRSENAIKLATATLNNAMGIPNAPEYILEDNLSFVKYDATFENALSRAYENRPDMKSVISRRKAAEGLVELSRKNYFPVLSGSAGYNWSGEKFQSQQDGWNIGAAVSFPLFSGFLTKYQVEESKANVDVQRANEELQKQSIFLDVQNAYLNLKEAEDRIPVAELSVKQATENLDIANGRYSAGVGSPVEVTDAQVAYTNAKTTYIQALSDYKVAQASLEKAMGIR